MDSTFDLDDIAMGARGVEPLETHWPLSLPAAWPTLKCRRRMLNGQRNGVSSPTSVDIEDRTAHEPICHQEKDRLGDVIGGSDAPDRVGMRNAIEVGPCLCLRETRSPER
jgi:hypothetical protein